MSTDADTIWVHSHVSASSGEGYVVLQWGPNQAQMTSDEAIALALGIIEAAHAAETDAALGKVFGGFDETTARLLLLLREQHRMEGSRFPELASLYRRWRASAIADGRDPAVISGLDLAMEKMLGRRVL